MSRNDLIMCTILARTVADFVRTIENYRRLAIRSFRFLRKHWPFIIVVYSTTSLLSLRLAIVNTVRCTLYIYNNIITYNMHNKIYRVGRETTVLSVFPRQLFMGKRKTWLPRSYITYINIELPTYITVGSFSLSFRFDFLRIIFLPPAHYCT